MTTDQIVSALATVTLIEMMLTIGLGVSLRELINVGANWRLVSRAALANYVLVPLATIGLVVAFRASPLVAAGLLIAAACPGAPYGPPLTALARGNVAVAIGLMVVLAGSSALLAPLILSVALPVVSRGDTVRIDALGMVRMLAISQFLPLCLGLWLRHARPIVADRLKRPMTRLSTLLNIALLTLVLVVQFRTLIHIPIKAFIGMPTLVAANAIIGWFVGGPAPENRLSLSLTTAVRNVGLSLAIVTSNFPGTIAVTAATTFALFQTVLMAAVAIVWGRGARAGQARSDQTEPAGTWNAVSARECRP